MKIMIRIPVRAAILTGATGFITGVVYSHLLPCWKTDITAACEEG